MKIVDFLREDLIVPDIRARRKDDVIHELAARLALVDGLDATEVERVISEREKLGSTALAEGIAIPHAKLDALENLVGLVGRSRKGVEFGSEDGSPTHLIFVLMAPQNSAGSHLKALARISRLFRSSSVRSRLMAAETSADIYGILAEEDAAPAQ